MLSNAFLKSTKQLKIFLPFRRAFSAICYLLSLLFAVADVKLQLLESPTFWPTVRSNFKNDVSSVRLLVCNKCIVAKVYIVVGRRWIVGWNDDEI